MQNDTEMQVFFTKVGACETRVLGVKRIWEAKKILCDSRIMQALLLLLP